MTHLTVLIVLAIVLLIIQFKQCPLKIAVTSIVIIIIIQVKIYLEM